MIEFDLRTYLLTDATLKALIGWGATNPKIYGSQAPAKVATPYLLIDWSLGDASDELLDEDRIQITIEDTDREHASTIRDRIKYLLSRQDGIQQTTMNAGSVDHFVYTCKMTGGSESVDTEAQEVTLFLFFNVKIKNRTP